MGASGTVGRTITFDKRGFVRQRIIPANPRTVAQQLARLKLKNVNKLLHLVKHSTRVLLRARAPVPSRWLSFTSGEALPHFDGYGEVFADLDANIRQAWNDVASEKGVIVYTIPGSTVTLNITNGRLLFIVATTLYVLGIGTELGAPAGGNEQQWGDLIAE
jgi:hypothetical protein